MAANHLPILVLTPNTATAVIAAANTARDGSGALVTVMTGAANGSRVDFVTFISAQATPAASSAMVGRVFISDPAGANPRLLSEVLLPTITPSNTVIGQSQTINFVNGLMLGVGQILYATISVYAGVQDQFQVIARGGDY